MQSCSLQKVHRELSAKEPRNSISVWKHPVRIGVADDEAFCFFYEDNFRLLRKMGAELVHFSPMQR